MNATLCSLFFIFFYSLSLIFVSASPALPSVPLPNSNSNNNNNNNVPLSSSSSSSSFSKKIRTHSRSITDPNPTVGNQRLLVITVEYPDRPGAKYTGQQWKEGMFSKFVSYFKAQSYNKLQYEVDVVTVDANGSPVINSNTAGNYIPLPKNITNYANGMYGWAFNTEWSIHTVVNHAAKYLDSKNFSWAPYTQQDRIVNVVVMSAGYDYRYAEKAVNNSASKYLLSTSFSGAQFTSSSGAVLNSYTLCNEHTQRLDSTPIVMAQLGQCVHEYGHALGIPDLYDISAQSSGVGYFDLMGYGLYANKDDGSQPVGMSAWSKLELGWITPQVITSAKQVQLGACSASASNFLQIYPNTSSTSYLLVENRQSLDTWDKNFASQLSNGILIWQVNTDDVEEYKYWNTINTLSSPYLSYPTPSSPSMIVREADGKQGMNTLSSTGYLDYGSSADVWQAGRSYTVAGTTFRIVIVALSDTTYTISVVYPTSSTPAPTPTPYLPVETPPTASTTRPTSSPTVAPASTSTPTSTPTSTSTSTPTSNPNIPTSTPTSSTPTSIPTSTPSIPTSTPTSTVTEAPTTTPAEIPTSTPTSTVTEAPTSNPTSNPTSTDSPSPTSEPTSTITPSSTPSVSSAEEYDINALGQGSSSFALAPSLILMCSLLYYLLL